MILALCGSGNLRFRVELVTVAWEEIADLEHVREELARLVSRRLLAPLGPYDQARYEALAEQEIRLLRLDHPPIDLRRPQDHEDPVEIDLTPGPARVASDVSAERTS